MKQAIQQAQYLRVSDACVALQKQIRAINARLIYSAVQIENSATIVLQKLIRSRLAQNEFSRLQSAVAIQKHVRREMFVFFQLSKNRISFS